MNNEYPICSNFSRKICCHYFTFVSIWQTKRTQNELNNSKCNIGFAKCRLIVFTKLIFAYFCCAVHLHSLMKNSIVYYSCTLIMTWRQMCALAQNDAVKYIQAKQKKKKTNDRRVKSGICLLDNFFIKHCCWFAKWQRKKMWTQ